MPLNKLDNFIKNTEGRILYVNPSDLDSTDSVTNEGNSLVQPFKTIQRALLEAARFSYLRGNNNDLTEKTTILLFPGEHVIDNRPGYAIFADTNNPNIARVSPLGGGITGVPEASAELSLELDSNFDLTQENNILYKFNSVYGGVIVPRGTSIVGLDLRKTKIRPKYVPNPTDPSTPNSAIFRITGACYFWQFSIFDGDDTGKVYTNQLSFSSEYTSQPRFSHHKLTCFEYCDGVNYVNRTSYGQLTDLDMYYSKVSNAYNSYREIESDNKFPKSLTSFAKRAPEWEIVGAFKSDPINILNIFSGNGTTATNRITVTTVTPHGLNVGTPIKIRGVSASAYNVSTLVQDIESETRFTYLLPSFEKNLPVTPTSANATVTVETDTVGGASPYIFNISLRSVWGMNGMFADGSKASGFRSMVVAQFTAVSLQKDDRAFVKYSKTKRSYDEVSYTTVFGDTLPLESSQTNSDKVYHLDQDAIYRPGWESSHIKIANDSFIQIVSVFAIGFTYHFDADTGGDASITNSNSNFGQVALKASGYKKEAFEKDNHGYVTAIISPKNIDDSISDEIEWVSLDALKTITVNNSKKIYLSGFKTKSGIPISLTQGYRIGAKLNDKLFINFLGTEYSSEIYMTGKTGLENQDRNEKKYTVSGIDGDKFLIGAHNLKTGEKILIQSKKGDLPENITEHVVYYAITSEVDNTLNSSEIRIAASYTYAFLAQSVNNIGGESGDLLVLSRVIDKDAGDFGSPIQWDESENQWYINVGSTNNTIFSAFTQIGYDLDDENKFSDIVDSYVKRTADERGLDEKIYKLRVVIPKEVANGKNPETGFIIQDTSFTGASNNNDIVPSLKSTLTSSKEDTSYRRNQKFIAYCVASSGTVTVTTELPHKLKKGDIVVIRGVKDDNETATGEFNRGFNGTFAVTNILNDMQFTYSTKDVVGLVHVPGDFLNDTNNRSITELPRLEKRDNNSNLYIYRVDILSDYVFNEKDGIYHLYVLNANNAPEKTFTNYKFTQPPTNLYPELDRDNYDSNPKSSKTYAKRAPVGDVVINDLKKSITRESLDIFCKDFGRGLEIQSVSSPQHPTATITFAQNHGFGGVVDGTLVAGSSGRNNGTYYNVKLFNENTFSNWNGATAKIVVESGNITSYEIMSKGSGYQNGNKLYIHTENTPYYNIGGSADAYIDLTSAGISTYVGSVVQVTGDGFTDDQYYRISAVNSKNTIIVNRHSSDPSIVAGQYVFNIQPSVKIQTKQYGVSQVLLDGENSISVGIITFTTYEPHGLNVGNKFRVITSANKNVGDFTVSRVNSVSSLSANVQSGSDISESVVDGYILKHGMSSNDLTSDLRSENYSARGIPFYGGETFKLTSQLTAESAGPLNIQCLTGISTSKRLKLGDFIQIDDEIMRIKGGITDTSIEVFRGYLGTRPELHVVDSVIKKIDVIPIELRRPTIVRASGHTFEYLGYGPGNYSTALPQVQVKTLSEREDFLVQAQERAGGAVIYTGMNSKGDTYNGNTKVSASSGQTISYDIPKPSVTGQDPSKLNVSFDEITVKERILVEGGTSGAVLTQFNGPVTATKSLRVKGRSVINGQLRVNSRNKSTNQNTGGMVVKGGIGVGDDSYFRQKIEVLGEVKTHTGLVPDEKLGAYLGTVTLPYKEAFIGSIRIGGNNSGINSTFTIDTVNNVDLRLDSSKGTVIIDDQLSVTGFSTFNEHINIIDSKKIQFGTDKDTELYHDNSHYYIDNKTGSIYIRNNVDDDDNGDIYIQAKSGENSIVCNEDGSVELYWDNSKKLETTADGLNITGITTASTGFVPLTDNGAYLGTAEKSFSQLYVGNILVDGNSISITQTNGSLTIQGNGTGSVVVNDELSCTSLSSSGAISGGAISGSSLNVSTGNITGGAISGSSLNVSTGNITGGAISGSSLTISGNTTLGDNNADSVTINGNLYVTQDITAFFNPSDRNWKDNITPIENALSKVLAISGNTFDWNGKSNQSGKDVGVIAQEVREVLPEAVAERDDGHLSVSYLKLIPLLVESIKEMNLKISDLEQKLQDK